MTSRCRILLVEDQAVIRELIRRFLEKVGFSQVAEAGTAEAAWDCLQGAEGQDIDILLTDLELPGMSGMELLWKMRSSAAPFLQSLPAVVLTGKLDAGTAEVLEEVGVSAFLVKPTTPEMLRVTIELALARKLADMGGRGSAALSTIH